MPFAEAVLEAAFGRYVRARGSEAWYLKFPDGGQSELFFGEPPLEGLAINRPPASPGFWQGLFEVMRDIGGVIHWPGGCAAFDPAVASHLPPEFHTSGGPGTPALVSSSAELIAAIERT